MTDRVEVDNRKFSQDSSVEHPTVELFTHIVERTEGLHEAPYPRLGQPIVFCFRTTSGL